MRMARNEPTLAEMGYPSEGIIEVDRGGGDGYEMPQEALSPHTCGWCRKCDSGETCTKDGREIDVDTDSCDDIDYQEEWLDTSYGFRSPVRCEYSSDKTYKQACEAIKAINSSIKDDYEERRYERMGW